MTAVIIKTFGAVFVSNVFIFIYNKDNKRMKTITDIINEGMTMNQVNNIALNIIKPEEIAETMLKSYWKEHGHTDSIENQKDYNDKFEHLVKTIETKVKEIGNIANTNVLNIEYTMTKNK